ncbi:hypothetical protein LF41_1350 [Lysobacter dokdonensis DS-58]|uniref:Uncharacterized protein n=1 Tax=Lysobacter dokdonensis DS-58 TaxID=1300345 RepID=A0A0A2WDR5_9GAMM|nr:hypothetical protein [Lysobacter dokdonensis]KGQ18351.1 hypothetical protein LF41_1350 [Lysobacter dokdonensis DS-58]
MAKTETVQLKLQPGAKNGNGWNTITAPNTQQVYSFKYTGGDKDNGGLKTTVGDGTATLNLNLDTDNRYSVNNVTFRDDDNPPQLSRTFTSSTAVITDQNTANLSADYCVMVLDSTNGSMIPCDPIIANDPKHGTVLMAHRITHQ